MSHGQDSPEQRARFWARAGYGPKRHLPMQPGERRDGVTCENGKDGSRIYRYGSCTSDDQGSSDPVSIKVWE